MRSLRDDEADVWDYSEHDAAFIGEKTAAHIDDRISDIRRGRVVCRVQFVPLDDDPDDAGTKFPSIWLIYGCTFINARFAVNNLSPDLLRLAKVSLPKP